MAETIHQGRNIKRFREMMGLKQEALAFELGEDWNQKKISLLEGKEVVDEALLEQMAKVLKVTPEVIKNFDEEMGIAYFNTFHDNSFTDSYVNATANQCNFNPLDKYAEAVEKNELLHEENRRLYERLLEAERSKNQLLQDLLNGKMNPS